MRSSSTRTETAEAAASIFSAPRWPSSRRTHSLSSFSSSSSSSASSSGPDSLPPSPATPLRRYSSGGGVPFSWETLPGIPKNNQIILKKVESSCRHSYLPLPPAAKSNRKHYENATGSGGDPFFTALVECSKGGGAGDDEDNSKEVFGSVWKGVMPKVGGGRNLFMSSCKNASDIAESLVLIPSRGRNRRIGYEMVKK